jgi:aspartyl-tRNA(Asn)/glutamyl-tRNA(Gln) amidotransferase subunit A
MSTVQTWQGDACSLVEAFRRGERSPAEELAAVYDAIEASDLNAFSHLDREAAEQAAAVADVSLPFGGVPIGVKELEAVGGWPLTDASVPLRDRVADHTSTMVRRLQERGGVVLAGQTTSSEFGGTNCTCTLLHGATHNPWRHGRTPGGSSGGTAAAVAGGILTIATGSDGGGSIRIPAGFTGLFGLKATYGRIPAGPRLRLGNLTSVVGCLSRSVRDTARWFDVCNGHDATDPLSLPRVDGWEAGLGTHLDELRGMRVAVVPDWGGATVSPAMWDLLEDAAAHLVADCGLVRVDDADTRLPRLGGAWSLSGTLGTLDELGDRWPACADELTPEMRAGLRRL